MSAPLRILVVEDSELDAKLMVHELARAGHALEFRRVETADAMRAALAEGEWDLVLSDWALPQFSGAAALEVLKASGEGIPFIIVSGMLGEQVAVEAMRAGAQDYVLKTDLSRLPVAVERELRGRKSRDLAERTLRSTEQRLATLTDAIHEVFWLRDLEQHRPFVSPSFERVWGRPYVDAEDTWAASLHPEDRARVLEAVRAVPPDAGRELEYRILRPDGTVRWIRERSVPVRDQAGAVTGVASAAEDVTERRALEEQLLQAQKLEAIGSLAGGIAHDFNNLLSVILSDVTLLRPKAPPAEELAEIEKAALRAAALTRQLLTFSRRAVLQPRVVDLNEIVGGMESMLRRLIGERIQLCVVRSPERATVHVDPGQMEQVIMNLVVNARDAMPAGGRLTLELGRARVDAEGAAALAGATPGPHVVVSVTDTGVGMAPAIQARIFEPFFTTKEVGKGTGLGLSTVFGIVRQSKGAITVRSAPGKGSVFSVYLPVADQPPERARAPRGAQRHGTETILLVEDEDDVRTALRGILEQHGYRVVEARDGGDALIVAQSEPTIDLLVTDVVMPRMNGVELWTRLHAVRPRTGALFVSGYTDDAAIHDALREPGTAFLQKPALPAELLARVRQILDDAAARSRLGLLPVAGSTASDAGVSPFLTPPPLSRPPGLHRRH